MQTQTRSSPTVRQEARTLRRCTRESPYKATWSGTWDHPSSHYVSTVCGTRGERYVIYECDICGRWFERPTD